MIESLFAFLTGLNGRAVYAAIFGMLLLCGLGLPIPEDITLLTAGYLSESKVIDRQVAVALCMGAVLLGDLFIFSLGRRYGESILDRPFFRRIFTKKRMETSSYYFEKYGGKVVFGARFVAGVRAPVFLISGILKMPYWKFILLDGIAALVSVPLLVWVGHEFAGNLHVAFKAVRRSQHMVLIVLGFALAAVILYQIYISVERAAAERAARKYEDAHPEAGSKAHILPRQALGISHPLSPIYKAYDIRGRVPGELDEDLARRIGWAIGRYLGAPEMAVGRDIRSSSPRIAAALSAGLWQAGVSVKDLGLATTPLLNFAVGSRALGGGVMVTASHNPPDYNGFKIARAGAVPVYDAEIRRIGELAAQAPAAPPILGAPPPPAERLDVREEFIEKTLARAQPAGRRLKVVVDLSNGAAATLTPDLLRRLPHDFVILNGTPDGRFPGHEPDPLKESNLEQARAAILREKADLGAVYDGDADRIVFLDDTGRTVTGDLATLLISLDLMAAVKEKKPIVFYDVRCSRIVPETLRAAGAEARRCRVGHPFAKMAMRENNGLCAGELSGHYYFRDNFYAEHSDLALVLLLHLTVREGKPLSLIVAPYRKYFASGEINLEVEDKQAAIERAAARFSDGEHSRLDGLSVDYPDWWFNLRPSNTEPLLRLNVESLRGPRELERHRQEVTAALVG